MFLLQTYVLTSPGLTGNVSYNHSSTTAYMYNNNYWSYLDINLISSQCYFADFYRITLDICYVPKAGKSIKHEGSKCLTHLIFFSKTPIQSYPIIVTYTGKKSIAVFR